MARLLLHRLTRYLLPALLGGIAVLYLQEPLAARIQGSDGFWHGLLAFLAIAGILLGILFGQWRASIGILVISAWYFLTQGSDFANARHVSDLATLVTLIGLVLMALIPERGPLGTAPVITAGLLVVSLGLVLRGVDAALAPFLRDALLPWTLPLGGGFHLTPGAMVGIIAIVTVSLVQLWRPEVVRGGLLASLLCLLPLTQGVASGQQALLLSGAAVLFLWMGLLTHAWQLAFVDELTGLPNRRALELRLRRGHRPLVMVDVDNFKKFNDRWGHAAGDHVLRRVAQMLAQTGGGARAYRYGGEEFTLVLPQRPVARLQALLEATRKTIFEHPFRIRSSTRDKRRRGQGGGKPVRVSVSFGLAMPRRGEAVQETLRRADSALYRAKRNGRNRVEISPS